MCWVAGGSACPAQREGKRRSQMRQLWSRSKGGGALEAFPWRAWGLASPGLSVPSVPTARRPTLWRGWPTRLPSATTRPVD